MNVRINAGGKVGCKMLTVYHRGQRLLILPTDRGLRAIDISTKLPEKESISLPELGRYETARLVEGLDDFFVNQEADEDPPHDAPKHVKTALIPKTFLETR